MDTEREVVDWNILAQDGDRWRSLVRNLMNLRGFHKRRGNSSLAERLSVSYRVNFLLCHLFENNPAQSEFSLN